MLNDLLKGSHVTEPCKEFLRAYVKTNLAIGCPPRVNIPLTDLGINMEMEEYGIFDSNANLKEIEARLLEFHDHTTEYLFTPELKEEEEDLNKRWHYAFDEKYK